MSPRLTRPRSVRCTRRSSRSLSVGRRGLSACCGLWVWRITDRKSDPVVRVLCPGVRRSTYGVGVHVSLRFLYRRRYSREPAPHVCILQSRDVYVRMGWAWQAPSLFGLTRRPYQRPERGSVLATADRHGSQTSRELASMTPFVTRGAVPGGRCDLRTEPAGIDATGGISVSALHGQSATATTPLHSRLSFRSCAPTRSRHGCPPRDTPS